MQPTALSGQKLTEKPAVRQKAVPQVRQTLTSYKRILLANPFLAKDINEFQKVTKLGLKSSTEFIGKFKQISHSNTAPTQKPSSAVEKQPNVSALHKDVIKQSCKVLTKKPDTKTTQSRLAIKAGQSSSKQVKFSQPAPSNHLIPTVIKTQCIIEKTSKTIETPLIDRAQSVECLNISRGEFENISPIPKKEQNTQFLFRTPTAYRRRSRSVDTPMTNMKSTQLLRMSTPQPFTLQKLQDRLNKWLKSRGKPVALFHNLRTFTDETPYMEENKENMDTSQCKNASFETLNVLEPNETVKPELDPKISNSNDRQKYTKEALKELQNLIEDTFPANQCYSWLQLIKEKCPEIVNEPEYWECRAAVEQTIGNVHNAVEFYQKAIIHGAEVSNVDKSLNQLLKKFSLLNIDPDCAKNSAEVNRKQEKVINEARNVFISSIINFAVYKRRENKNEPETNSKRYAVPVRRSTRLSRGAYVNTSGVQLCKSLKELDDASDIIFHSNNAFC